MEARYVRDVEVAGSNPASPTSYGRVLGPIMIEAHHDLGKATSIKASAIGVPGERRFRCAVQAPGGSATLWVEKEQLLQLGVSIKRLLAQVPEGADPPRGGPGIPLNDPLAAQRTWDFQVGALTLGHDSSRNLFIVAARDVDADEDALPLLRFWLAGQQLDTLAEEAFEVCAAGRPLCPLCHAPVDPNETHICPKSNGHHTDVDFE